MDIALFIARLLLATIFVVAGVTKLADLPGSRQAIREFGLPAALANPLGLLLPLVEIAVAIALIPRDSAWWGALGALFLLLGFIAAIVTSLVEGRQPDCHCFGQLHSAPAGKLTLARNAGLALVAAFIVWQGHSDTSVIAWLSDLTAPDAVAFSLVALAITVAAVEGWAVLHLLRQQGQLLIRLDELEARASGSVETSRPGLPAGTPAPAFVLPTLDGERVSLAALLTSGRDILLVFMHPSCGPCNALLPDLVRWQHELAGRLEVVVIGRHDPHANRAKAEAHGLRRILMDVDLGVARTYGALATPTAVHIRPDGTIGEPLASGYISILALVPRITMRGDLATSPVGNGQRRARTVPASTLAADSPLTAS